MAASAVPLSVAEILVVSDSNGVVTKRFLDRQADAHNAGVALPPPGYELSDLEGQILRRVQVFKLNSADSEDKIYKLTGTGFGNEPHGTAAHPYLLIVGMNRYLRLDAHCTKRFVL